MPQPTAKQILHEVFGYPEFRGKQEAIVNALAGGESLMVLMPTGGGKSLCYQIPALMREGVAVVVSPLIALMNDQVASLHVAGIEAAAVNSSTSADEAREIADKLAQGRLKLGVYANAFEPVQGQMNEANDGLDPIRADATPENYLAWARQWVDLGAEIIGGCCGIAPEHIRALAQGFKAV